jgi:hypothetical protein
MKSKKGQEYITEFVFATIILTIVFLIFLFAAEGFIGFILPRELNVAGSAEEIQISPVCGADLVNFLRFIEPESGLTYSELIAINPESPELQEKIQTFLDENYKRGNPNKQQYNFFVKQEGINLLEVIKLNREALVANTCSAVIPALKGNKYIAKLELRY